LPSTTVQADRKKKRGSYHVLALDIQVPIQGGA
jgi:hypothetical protein